VPHPSSAVGGVFRLPTNLARKADPALVADDERHFAAVADAVAHAVADLAARLDETRRTAVSPRSTPSHRPCAPCPMGVTAPIPVMTTRLPVMPGIPM